MSLPRPRPGLVLRYSFLWRDEAVRGVDEGRKDRHCVVILAVETIEGATVVTVAPITHRPPARPDDGIGLSIPTKRRLGLDDDASWVVTNDLNRFTWPGFDLRSIPQNERFDYGELPADLTRRIRDSVLNQLRSMRAVITPR